MTTERLRVGVLGVGHIGKIHARVYSELEEVEFAAVYDVNQSAAEEVARQYGIQAARSVEEFAEMVDAATISTPTFTHHEMGLKLLKAGVHLLIEKPITEFPAEAQELVAVAGEKGLVLQVGHIERFNPALDALETKLTHPRFIEVHRLSPYPARSTDIGVVLDLMIHDLEVILHLVRSKVVSVDAVGVPVLSKSEDIANARLRFENGCVVNLTVSRISPEKLRKIRVFQEDAYLSLDYQNQSGEVFRKVDGRIEREVVDIVKEEPLKRELAAFVECARSGATPKVGGREAGAALELASEITRLIQAQNQTWTVGA